MAEPETTPRCLRCWRPPKLCLCHDLPTAVTRTRILVLQHRAEQRHPFGTARFVKMCMPNSEVHVALGSTSQGLRCEFAVPPGTAVLYPHAQARDLTQLPTHELPQALLVLDGTWGHAKALYRDNPWLQQLPHVRFTPAAPSRYRIRKEPRADYVSTLEAIIEALAIIEPAFAGAPGLLAAFDRMVDAQIAHVAQAPRAPRQKKQRQRASRALPDALFDDNLFVCYAESSRPLEQDAAPGDRELVQWAAVHVASGRTFDAVLRPVQAGPSVHHLAHMQLSEADVSGGEWFAAARARFHAFAGERPVIATWTPTTYGWGANLLPDHAQHVSLKTAWCNLHNRAAGFLEELVPAMGLPVPALPCRGRARLRLANAVALAHWLRAQRSCPLN